MNNDHVALFCCHRVWLPLLTLIPLERMLVLMLGMLYTGTNIGVDGGRALGLAARELVSLQGVQLGDQPIPVGGLRDGSLTELDLAGGGLGGAAGAAFLAPLLEVSGGALTQLDLRGEVHGGRG